MATSGDVNCKIDGADFQNVNFTGDDFAGATIRSLPEKKLAMTELNLLTKTCLIAYDLCRKHFDRIITFVL